MPSHGFIARRSYHPADYTPLRMSSQLGIVGYEHQRSSLLRVEPDQQFQERRPLAPSKIPRRFVGEQDRRPDHEGARQSDTLLLPAGELDGVMIHAIRKTDFLHEIISPVASADHRWSRRARTEEGHSLQL